MELYPTWCALKNFTADEFSDLQNLFKHIPIEHPYYEKKLFDKIANADANTYTTIEFTKDDVFVNCFQILLQYRQGLISKLWLSDEVIQEFKKRANKNNADAMNNLGLMYSNDLGTEKNLKEASRWWEKAAKLGNTDAMVKLGQMYFQGFATEKNLEEAFKWWEKAAKLGNADAINNLGPMYVTDEGIKKDNKEALKRWEKAAAQGNAPAMVNLGLIYFKGLGTEKNLKEALRCWEKAAKLGNAYAMAKLGLMYYKGVDRDYQAARHWWGNALNHDMKLLYHIVRTIHTGTNRDKNLRDADALLKAIYKFIY